MYQDTCMSLCPRNNIFLLSFIYESSTFASNFHISIYIFKSSRHNPAYFGFGELAAGWIVNRNYVLVWICKYSVPFDSSSLLRFRRSTKNQLRLAIWMLNVGIHFPKQWFQLFMAFIHLDLPNRSTELMLWFLLIHHVYYAIKS